MSFVFTSTYRFLDTSPPTVNHVPFNDSLLQFPFPLRPTSLNRPKNNFRPVRLFNSSHTLFLKLAYGSLSLKSIWLSRPKNHFDPIAPVYFSDSSFGLTLILGLFGLSLN